MNEIYVEKRSRGFFGWILLILFMLWNLAMVAWLVAYIGVIGKMPEATFSPEQAGSAIGSTIGFTMILIVWAFGSVITGLLALVTRGSKTIVKRYR